jgi:acetyl-CoA C-acetyltransferase/acetyl-CoA acyltransferase
MEKKIYMAAGYNTISMGTGRKEFHPAKPRPGLEDYIKEAGLQVLSKIGGSDVVDETVIGNFMAGSFNGQAHLGAFAPYIDKGLAGKPSTRVEAACASGGLALLTGIKSVLSGSAEVVLALGVEVQNSVKAIYGADILATAGWAKDRKAGHAFFFPGQFSDRAGVYFEKYGRERTRKAFARWYRNAIENARLCHTAQEFHNTVADLEVQGLTEPNGKTFVEYLNFFDCSKVSDGASAIAIVSREGLRRIGLPVEEAVEITGFGHAVENITMKPADPVELSTGRLAAAKALKMSGIPIGKVGTVETHDCFTIAGILGVEALGLAKPGEGVDYVLAGETSRMGEVPFNTTGGLIGWGHPTGATGVHMAVTIWEQLTGKAGKAQINLQPDKPFGLSLNMGGDDKTLVSIVYKRGE